MDYIARKQSGHIFLPPDALCLQQYKSICSSEFLARLSCKAMLSQKRGHRKIADDPSAFGNGQCMIWMKDFLKGMDDMDEGVLSRALRDMRDKGHNSKSWDHPSFISLICPYAICPWSIFDGW